MTKDQTGRLNRIKFNNIVPTYRHEFYFYWGFIVVACNNTHCALIFYQLNAKVYNIYNIYNIKL